MDINRVSEVRSYFGAAHNHLESAIRNNDNKVENTTAAFDVEKEKNGRPVIERQRTWIGVRWFYA